MLQAWPSIWLNRVCKTGPAKMAHELTPEERLQAFEDHMKEVESRPKIDVVADYSRESIHEGRGE